MGCLSYLTPDFRTTPVLLSHAIIHDSHSPSVQLRKIQE
jgi:hypothetical protein